ncbi:hypothetical protein DPMN_164644 [Dreissena polymorpha]|uniref:Uncharacterized protein n=1 Tax=Dreissena polymorpha TaxID=45954 RepID=A0A9D4EUK9_DREPO|nr:hypothetical protein DPMN_164644 [Dreissena polymorpha]
MTFPHSTGNLSGHYPRPIIVNCISYKARQQLHIGNRELKTRSGDVKIFITILPTQCTAVVCSMWTDLMEKKICNLPIRVTENGEATMKQIDSESELDKYKVQ